MKRKRVTFMVVMAGLALGGCSKSTPEEKAPATNETSSGNPLTAPVDYVGAVGRAQKSATQTTSLVGIQQAIKMFEVQEGRFPKDLNEVVGGDYLPRLPDPPAGMKYDYNAQTGTVRLVPR